MQYKRISADCHLDMIWLPPDLFTSEAPRELKERMPFVSEGPNGKEWVARNGASFGLVAGVGSAGRKYEPGKQHRADRMAETGLMRPVSTAYAARGIRTCAPRSSTRMASTPR